MDSTAESFVREDVAASPRPTTSRARTRKAQVRKGGAGKGGARPPRPILRPWLHAQSINVTRHAAALRPFRREEFGIGAAVPSEGHIQAVNALIGSLRRGLLKMSGQVTTAAAARGAGPTHRRRAGVMRR